MKKGNKEPNPMVHLSVLDAKKESKVSLTQVYICDAFNSLFSFINQQFVLDLLHYH